MEGRNVVSWSRRLPKRIYLNDGRIVTTLAEAREVWLALHPSNPHWRNAGDLLMKAAYSGRQTPIVDAHVLFAQALKAGGLI
jgi:hypothetical protein